MPNRLAREASPYLLQHAENPVDWYPWGPEALELARREDRPILLSVGYSACHWCHVMAHECFEDDAIAGLMNGWFVNVKVDREERPDLDQVYQLVVQLMGRSGGWPLTVFLTPEQKPFFAGTYFPPVDRHGMPGFPKVLQAVWEAYRARRSEVEEQSSQLVEAIAEAVAPGAAAGPSGVSAELVSRATERLVSRFDEVHGGFGHRPKFPSTMSVDLLLRTGQLPRARKALDGMRAGGIWDQLGGGFHRYSTDERWLVPHFEKMLYDNALLLRLYTDGWRATRDERYAATARDIAAYLAREMTAPDGAFYATTDADSADPADPSGHPEEGLFFVWTPAEVDAACGEDTSAAAAAKAVWGISDGGNFEESGATVLSLARPPSSEAEAAALERARARMLEARARRPPPFRDEKILASWNALAIGALADAGAALGVPSMVDSATRAMAAIERMLVVPGEKGTRVMRLAKDGVAKGQGFLDDHAYLADAALDLYAATGEPRYVRLARGLADAVLAHFHDREGDAFFFTPDDGEALLVRARDPYDHAVPSGASIACRALLRLGAMTDATYAEPATRAIERLAPAAAESPGGMAGTLALADRLVRGGVDVVVTGARADERTRALVAEAMRAYLPDRNVAWLDPANPATREACAVLAEGKTAGVAPVAYVCRGRTCSLPIASADELREELEHPSPRAPNTSMTL